MHRARGDDGRAYETCQDVAGEAETRGDNLLRAAALLDMAQIDLRHGYGDDAVELGRQTLDLLPADDTANRVRTLRLLADAEVSRHRGAEGLALGQRVVDLVAGTTTRTPMPCTTRPGRALRAGLAEDALGACDQLEAHLSGHPDQAAERRCEVALVRVGALERLGQADAAEQLGVALLAEIDLLALPRLRGDVLWALARLRGHDAQTYDLAIAAWAEAGAADAWLQRMREQRDDLVAAA